MIIGAAGHIGGPLAFRLAELRGADTLRLVSSRPDGVATLRAQYPRSDVVQLDMGDPDQLAPALADVSSVFVVTPDFFDEAAGAQALVEACGRAGVCPHIVRVQAEYPGVEQADLPGRLAGPIGRRGHMRARAIIEASGLPATFLNIVAYYMDDLAIHFSSPLRGRGELLVPHDRAMCWVDPADVGEAAANILAGPAPEGPRMITINNGEPGVRFSALAALLSDTLGRRVTYRDDADAFRAEVGPMLSAATGDPDACDYLLEDWQMEAGHPDAYGGSNALEHILGRKPKTLRAWIADNRSALAPV